MRAVGALLVRLVMCIVTVGTGVASVALLPIRLLVAPVLRFVTTAPTARLRLIIRVAMARIVTGGGHDAHYDHDNTSTNLSTQRDMRLRAWTLQRRVLMLTT